MNMKISHTALAMSLALLLGGCMVGPDYHRPQVPVPTQYKPLPGWTEAAPAAEAPKGDWWTVFNDPLLNQLEPMVSVSNQTVRARLRQLPGSVGRGASSTQRVIPYDRHYRIGHQATHCAGQQCFEHCGR